ncbi:MULTISPECIES: pyridoxal phosphate-dependent aminotransferase [Rhizobium/Agrobacterium group]|uniref:Aminotransferase n=2 Tax=Rhizobium/Agrobacterium group TaxID=227290 RepID=A0A9X3R1R7_9HYPH|nr:MULTISPECIES: pyridoxal phosphate-dependent aminotransferase [Rhizobium/Agrobacterium group]MBO9126236.1 pyridoxal phosphate-dependent aminotransferase [Rhizobium sp. 16-488-2b]MBO9176820.1 pyridoxal phosphate-dependent aminotransferase [Rhizobium sp. 16-488-2a]MBO9197389.1 pyridoxal phosphate-dependent aminotransferase [Rhizobium sp. 16-449-1b]MCZ7466750.1 pyridoxal phosphate-dependent aminotransferase [Rhizobium rhizogenes]MCZ7939220.1 pyridoxal phosphate-dependent aminotransferase [Agrob
MDTVVNSSHFRPAERLVEIGVSEILKITGHANELKKQGRDVIILGAGEPDFDTPDNIKEAAVRAIAAGQTKYTALDGTAELKAAIRHKFKTENGLEFEQNQITVAAGAKQVIYNAMMATLNPGDEVIIPTPFWVTYADIVLIAGGKPVLVPCREENGFRLSPSDLEAAITPKTRWLMLNSPSNPSGAAYSAEQYRPLLDILLRHPQVWLMVDDMYEHIVYGDFEFVTPAAIEPRLAARTLTINGVSKAYAMTGWRIGYAGGPTELIRSMAIVQSQSTSCPSSVSQAAAVEALTGSQDILAPRRASFQQRRDVVVSALNNIVGISCRVPDGAFYTYASVEGLIGRKTPTGDVIDSDSAFASYLLRAADVAVVPGSAFGLAPYFRISYATSMEELVEACRRISVAALHLQ